MYGDVRGNAFSSAGPSISLPQDPIMPDASLAMGLDDDFSWEMIGLGLDEPLPQQDFIDELLVYPPFLSSNSFHPIPYSCLQTVLPGCSLCPRFIPSMQSGRVYRPFALDYTPSLCPQP
jgi:hypothetical protein